MIGQVMLWSMRSSLLKARSNPSYVEIAGAGHAVTIQCAAHVNDLLARHLDACTPRVIR